MLAALALAAILLISQTSGYSFNTNCCHSEFLAYHVCLGLPYEEHLKLTTPYGNYLDYFWVRKNKNDESAEKCVSFFCKDGSDAIGKHCGVSDCNIFGCNCVGGCRKGNGTGYELLRRAWLEKHDLVREAKHQFYVIH